MANDQITDYTTQMDDNISPEYTPSYAIADDVLDAAVNKSDDTVNNPTSDATLSAELKKSQATNTPDLNIKSTNIIHPDNILPITKILTGETLPEVHNHSINSQDNSSTVSNTIINNITGDKLIKNSPVNNITSDAIITKESINKLTDFKNTVIYNNLLESINKSKELTKIFSDKASATSSQILDKASSDNTTNTIIDTRTSSQKFLDLYNKHNETNESTEFKESTNNNTNTTSVKSNNLINKDSIKKILAPDQSLTTSVNQLTKALPDAVNNLSNSVTSMNPQTINSNVVTNEGSKYEAINQTLINKDPSPIGALLTHDPNAKPPASSYDTSRMQEFYLQAIYSALMSGKLKVKLEYQ